MRLETATRTAPGPLACATVALGLALVGLSAIAAPAAASATPVARAVPVTSLTIGGRLGDWPSEMVTYPIDRASEQPSWTSWTWGGSPDDPEDFKGRFHVGYDEAEGRLYVAVVIEDDEVGLPGHQQDGCSISLYLEGLTGTEMRYVLSAEPGATPKSFPMGHQTPGLDGASRRLGVTTVYEWALPLAAAWGDSVSLRLGVSDGDGREQGGFVSWGDVDREGPGALVLVREDPDRAVQVDPWGAGEASATLTGMVRDQGGAPLDDVPLAIRGDGRVAATVRTNALGGFAVDLLPRDYTIEAVPGFGSR